MPPDEVSKVPLDVGSLEHHKSILDEDSFKFCDFVRVEIAALGDLSED